MCLVLCSAHLIVVEYPTLKTEDASTSMPTFSLQNLFFKVADS